MSNPNLLEGVKLIRSPTNENNYTFVFTDKSRKPASMADVLLWELRDYLSSINTNIIDVETEVSKVVGNTKPINSSRGYV